MLLCVISFELIFLLNIFPCISDHPITRFLSLGTSDNVGESCGSLFSLILGSIMISHFGDPLKSSMYGGN